MAYITGLTMELAKYYTVTVKKMRHSAPWDSRPPTSRGMEHQIAAGRMVSIETTVTMNKVTDNFLSDTTEPEW